VAGRTIELVSERYAKSKADYDDSKARYLKLKADVKDLLADLGERRSKYKELRDRNCALVRRHFHAYLTRKGYDGDVVFDHKESKLFMNVHISASNKCSDVRQLSGGERSYTTLCLLMALGHVIESPFRVMDEYDVFLDEQTRKTTLNMLRDYALSPKQRARQFIIITPHNLNDIRTSNRCRLNKMPDPEKQAATGLQQQVLPFGGP
jgi:chromosome segregation ATPase